MFLVVDRDEGRAAALVTELGERGVAATARHNAFDGRAAIERDRPEAVVVALDGLDGAGVGQLVGRGAALGVPVLDPAMLAVAPVLFVGGRRGTVFRVFRAFWSRAQPFRWMEAAPLTELAGWAVEEARRPRPAGPLPRSQHPALPIALLVVIPLAIWGIGGVARELMSLYWLPFVLGLNAIQAVPPVVAAVRRGIPVSVGAWLLLGGLVLGTALVIVGPFVVR